MDVEEGQSPKGKRKVYFYKNKMKVLSNVHSLPVLDTSSTLAVRPVLLFIQLVLNFRVSALSLKS